MELLLEFSHGFHFSLFNDGVSTVEVEIIVRPMRCSKKEFGKEHLWHISWDYKEFSTDRLSKAK